MKKVYTTVAEFLARFAGRLDWPADHAREFFAACRAAGIAEWRISEPDKGQWLVVRIE